MGAPLYCATKHAIIGFVKSMKDSEPLTGVKVTALCPGAVMTPLFDAQKTEQFSFSEARALTPDACATQMLELLQKKDYACGSVLELTLAGGTRVIPEWNVSPPDGGGRGNLMAKGFKEKMLAPIEEALNKERSGANS
jgi:NAD(P)-dependent dehydrogenase (short-subunit alcohol dehydrogenase family)